MQTPLDRLGRALAAAFMAFALTALAHGAVSIAALSNPPIAAPAAIAQA